MYSHLIVKQLQNQLELKIKAVFHQKAGFLTGFLFFKRVRAVEVEPVALPLSSHRKFPSYRIVYQ